MGILWTIGYLALFIGYGLSQGVSPVTIIFALICLAIYLSGEMMS